MTEIEVKLTLEEADYRKVIDYFKGSLKETLDQWNLFFDTPLNEIRRGGHNLRIRRILSDKNPEKWFVTCKHGGMKNGIARKEEIETEISTELGKYLLTQPSDFFSKLPSIIQQTISFEKNGDFHIIGDFRTIRRVIPFEGLKIEADESFLPDSTKFFEIEIESDTPEIAKAKIEAKLNEIGAKYTNSRKSKMGRLMSLPEEKRFSMKNYIIQ